MAPAVVASARGLINECLGKGINKKDYHMRLKPDGTSTVDFCPELHTHPALLALFAQSGAPKLVESVLGLGAWNERARAFVFVFFGANCFFLCCMMCLLDWRGAYWTNRKYFLVHGISSQLGFAILHSHSHSHCFRVA